MAISGYRNVVAWQRAMDLATGSYLFGKSLRTLKHAALASQLERAAVSVPSNIAEGKGHSSSAEFARFLDVAMGSLRETETLLEIARRISAGENQTIIALQKTADEVGKVLFGLRKVARAAQQSSRKPPPRAAS
jgi:four helix bundle protein